MSGIYCAFSLQLNNRSLEQAGEQYLFKFGITSGTATPIDRLRNGWIEDDGTRSQPLARCQDWDEVGFWSIARPYGTERIILDKILTGQRWDFILRDEIVREIRAHDPKGRDANDNGINDIRKLESTELPVIEGIMHDINDPVASLVLRHTFSFIGLISRR